ncbi:hydroxyacylglutathione hydrolase [Sphingomonas lacunae]|uniref:Hydroxyacylglutathione hydrolase n=1 Tax=Sphingomonas lacunae TaxID=2698828 RepID=A0A6M4ATU3_9SPHN|nr:hydroxyacylglutathione hydrolase [Sphingomonas lacunae]QJQ31459.1 hydroxyacylglutathione hydrolase [Sphingomonas lacunae]
MPIIVARVPVLSDNYVWLAHDDASKETAAIDPAVSDPVLAAAAERGWTITQIWNTHWHPDHTGGNAAIKSATQCTIVGPAAEAERIPTLDRLVDEGDRVQLGSINFDVYAVPAHTAGHIAYYSLDSATLFIGDTLFAMGCGRLFEGTADQMFRNMQRLSQLPPFTNVYCAHEYTLSNARWAVTAEPGNEALLDRFARVSAMRDHGEPTVPTTIADELATNPFLRARDAKHLAELRASKDAF